MNAHLDDMIGMIYMCISNLNARLITLLVVVIQPTGNGMGTRKRKDHAHCLTGMTKLQSRKKQ